MSAVILKASSAIITPPADTPTLPDITTSLALHFKASSLSALADGASITAWNAVDGSEMSGNNGKFNNTLSTLVAPTFSATGGPAGGPALLFGPTSQLRTGAYVANTAPYTVGLLVKATEAGWVYSIGNSDVIKYLEGSFSGGSSTTSDNITQEDATEDWIPVIFCHGGTVANGSKLLVGRSQTTIKKGTGTTTTFNQKCLGAPSASVSGYTGLLAEILTFTRSFTDEDMYALQAYLTDHAINGVS